MQYYCETHKKAALETALRACVLLKNDGTLPLKRGTKVCLTGEYADSHELLGAWAVDGVREGTATLLDVFGQEKRILLTDAKSADVILFATGEEKQETGEAASKAHPELSQAQRETLLRLASFGKPVVLLLFCGRPLILTDILPKVSTLMNVWFPGTMGAEAIRRLVMGDDNPSGHLSMTFPRTIGQIPIHHDRLTSCRPVGSRGEGNRFVNTYIDEKNEPLFPFGFGLSHTEFALSLTELTNTSATIDIMNTGKYDGETVVQIYARLRKAPFLRPLRTLIGWQRISLHSGETKTLQIPLRMDRLLLFDENYEPIPPTGPVDIGVGFDSTASLCYSVSID